MRGPGGTCVKSTGEGIIFTSDTSKNADAEVVDDEEEEDADKESDEEEWPSIGITKCSYPDDRVFWLLLKYNSTLQ